MPIKQLIAVGAAAATVWGFISSIFGGGSGSSSDRGRRKDGAESDEPTKDAHPKEGAKWIVGGPGRTPGPKSEEVKLHIYPVGRSNKRGEDQGKLQVQIIPNAILHDAEALKAVKVITAFRSIEGGWSCAYTRPAAVGDYTIRVGVPGDTLDFACAVMESASVLGTTSVLEALGPVITRRGYAHIFPKDTEGHARFAHTEDSTAFTIEMHYKDPALRQLHPDQDKILVARNWLNDAIKLSFDPPSAGTYELRVSLNGKDIKGSPATVEVQSSADPTYSIAYGEGLCSGVAGQKTCFSIEVRDQFNAAMTANDNTACSAFLEGGGEEEGSGGGDLELSPSAFDAQTHLVTFDYTRPVTDSYYNIRILVNERPLDMSPVRLNITPDAAVAKFTKSLLTLPLPPYYAGPSKTYLATIEAYDQYGQRYLSSADTGTSLARADIDVTLQKKGSDIPTPVKWVEHPDGRYDIHLGFEEDGTYTFTCNVPTDASHPEGKPILPEHELAVLPPPALTSFRCYGPGLSSGVAGPTTFSVRGLDQAGKGFPITESDKGAFEVLLLHPQSSESAEITVTPDNLLNISYTRPPAELRTDNIIGMLYKGEHITGSPFLVSTAATAPANIDPERCVLISKLHKVDELSTAILVAIDTEGRRRLIGGDRILVPCDPAIDDPVVGVLDREDGTYAIDYYPDPKNEGKTVLKVIVEGVALAPFELATSPKAVAPTVVEQEETLKAELDESATLQIQGGGKEGDDKAYKGKLVLMADKAITEVLDVEVKAADALGLRIATFTVPKTVPGSWCCCAKFSFSFLLLL